MPHPVSNSNLIFGSVDMVKCRIRNDGKAWSLLKKYTEPLIEQTHYLKDAPFQWIGLLFMYGLINHERPHYTKLSKKHQGLHLSIELDTHELLDADKKGIEPLMRLFKRITLKCLIDVGKKYKLPYAVFENDLNTLEKEIERDMADDPISSPQTE